MRKLLIQLLSITCMLGVLPVVALAQESPQTDNENVYWSPDRVFRLHYPDVWRVTSESDTVRVLSDHENAVIFSYIPNSDFDSALAAVEFGINETQVNVLKNPLEFALDSKQVAMAIVDTEGRSLFYAIEDQGVLVSGFAYSLDDDDSQLEKDLVAVLERLEIFNYEPRTLPLLDRNTLERGDAETITTMLAQQQLIEEVDTRLLNEVVVVSELFTQMMLEEGETTASACVGNFVVSVRPRNLDEFFCGITIATEDVTLSVGLLNGETIALLDGNRASQELGLFLVSASVNFVQPYPLTFIIQDNRVHVFAAGRPVIEGWPLHQLETLGAEELRTASFTMVGSSCLMNDAWVYSLREPADP